MLSQLLITSFSQCVMYYSQMKTDSSGFDWRLSLCSKSLYLSLQPLFALRILLALHGCLLKITNEVISPFNGPHPALSAHAIYSLIPCSSLPTQTMRHQWKRCGKDSRKITKVFIRHRPGFLRPRLTTPSPHPPQLAQIFGHVFQARILDLSRRYRAAQSAAQTVGYV